MKDPYESFSKPLFYFSFALSVIIWILSIVLIVLLAVFGFVGLNNTTQISTTCSSVTQTYYATKYNSNSNLMVQISFIFSVLAVVFSTIVAVILLVFLVKLAKDEVVAFRNGYKVVLYVNISLLILSLTIPAGYYLSFWRQFPQCLVTSYKSSQVQTIEIIALIAVGFAVLLWFLQFCFFYERVSSQEKYRQVSSNPTEPNEKVKVYKYEEPVKKQPVIYSTYRKESPKQEVLQVHKLQETNQNLYESPSKRKINYVYSKQPEHIPDRSHNSQQRKLAPYQGQNSKFTPQRSYKKEPAHNEGELVYLKPRENASLKKDEDTYKILEQHYLGRNQGRSILPSSGLEEREKASDNFRSVGEPPRRFSPSKMNDKQGALVSYIRGKYAG